MKNKIAELASAIEDKYRSHLSEMAFTVAISGIDAAGKGHISGLLQTELEARGYRVALIHADPWQNPIPVRLNKENPAENVYEHISAGMIFLNNSFFPCKRTGVSGYIQNAFVRMRIFIIRCFMISAI